MLKTTTLSTILLMIIVSIQGFAQGTPCLMTKFIGSSVGQDDGRGESIALSNEYGLVGVFKDDLAGENAGAVEVLLRSGLEWLEIQQLVASDANPGDQFGIDVDIDGDYAIVGAVFGDGIETNTGAAYIFKLEDGIWIEESKLIASDGATSDHFGWGVSISGEWAIVGSSYNDEHGEDSGAAYLFHKSGDSWIEFQKLTANDAAAGEKFGLSVDIEDGNAVVGIVGDDDAGLGAGAVSVIQFDGSAWNETHRLVGSDTGPGDNFGRSVAVAADTILVGAWTHPGMDSSAGAAYVFDWAGVDWLESQKLMASDADFDDRFGVSVSLSEDVIIIGAHANDDLGGSSGSAYLFHKSDEGWTDELKLTPQLGEEADHFGISVSINANYFAVGAVGDDDAALDSGAAYIYGMNEWDCTTISSAMSCTPDVGTLPFLVPLRVILDNPVSNYRTVRWPCRRDLSLRCLFHEL